MIDFFNTPTRSNMLSADHFPRQMLRHRQNKKEVVPNLVSQRVTKAGHFSLCICPFPAMLGRACMVGHGRTWHGNGHRCAAGRKIPFRSERRLLI